ncbi:hypothetical protein [Shewanella sp. NIFS-20-20]|uniref:hypothetical protein n=1 Tax=Shewanella sp. NIFS-20-20 TaxID=2853806 RepID=UPI001C45C3D6|nr:hypothetical protein [Shewanella sp. NIFS-20-20]MBV7316953.1 hypothetical protein [Shewanella sp. NIFS-20-20]
MLAAETPPSESYEFKQLLAPSAFNSRLQIQDYQAALTHQLSSLGKLDGQLSLADQGGINYYDTKDCLLKQQGIIVRHRMHHQHWQLTIKQRSVYPQQLKLSPLMASGVMQADVLAKPQLHTIYGISQSLPQQKMPATIAELIQQFPALGRIAAIRDAAELALLPITQTGLQQSVYQGPVLPLGKHRLKFSLTLWSLGNNHPPLLSEISFKINNKHHKLDTETLQSAYLILETLATMSAWQGPINSTKTHWLYQQQHRCGGAVTYPATETPAK